MSFGMHERVDKSVLNWNLSSALSLWQEKPDFRDVIDRMQKMLKDAAMGGGVELMIRSEVLRSLDRDGSFISEAVAGAYGKVEGKLVTFKVGKDISARVGTIKKHSYLFLEKDGHRIGYCRPNCIAGIKLA